MKKDDESVFPPTTPATRVVVWNEHRHERANPLVAHHYPEGIHGALAGYLEHAGFPVRTATLDEPDHGLGGGTLEWAEVLIWWGHIAHHEVSDEIVERAVERVLGGMGLVVLHSGHFSKIFKRLMGTSCDLKWREAGGLERIWVIEPGHPIARGLDELIELPETEMYGERFDIPAPDSLVFISSFEGGEVFRSGCCFHRGAGKIFYFRPGHETYPIYHDPRVLRVIRNAVEWARPVPGPPVTWGPYPR